MQALRIVEDYRPSATKTLRKNPGTILFRSTEGILSSVWEKSKDGMLLTDEDGITVAVNKAYCSLVKMPQHGLIYEPLTAVYASERERQEALNDYRQKFETRTMPEYSEKQMKLHDGRVVDIEIAHSFIEAEDGTPLLLGVYRDVSRRKQAERALAHSEQNYRELFDKSVQGMFQVTIDGKLIDANPTLLQLLGYGSLEELKSVDIGKALYVNPRDRDRLTALLLQHGFCRDVELHLKRKDGKSITVLEHSRVIRDAQGNPVMFEGIIEDISERKEQERQLREHVDALRVAYELLAELNARKDKLLFALSHDLRSPLGSIIGFSEILLADGEKLPKEELQQFLTYIHDAAQNQLRVISELLEKPTTETDDLQKNPQETDLAEIGVRSIQLLSTVAKQKSIALSMNIPADAKAHVDGQLVLQVFNNLISNALKFTPAGGSITLELVDQTEQDWLVAVRDTGIGIPAEDLPKLFQTKGTYSRTGLSGEKGTGLGLSLCAEIMKELGSDISVDSSLGKGTTFFLRFPKSEPDRSINVLVVDDEAGIRSLHTKYIQRIFPGARVMQAADGQKALELMFRNKPQVVLSDYAMPKMNGLALLEAKKLHDETKDIPVVIATGHDSWAVREELESAGAYEVLSKPVPMAKIESILRATIPSLKPAVC